MQCPDCTKRLIAKASLGTTLYVCPDRCGLWFEAGTLPRYLRLLVQSERIKPVDTQLFQRRHVERVPEASDTSRKCPQCQSSLQAFNFFLIGWFGLQLLNGLLIDQSQEAGVGWFAHIGGFVGGLSLALLYRNYDH